MRIHLNDPKLVPSLLAFLREHVHVTAAGIGPDQIEVSQLGSLDADGRRRELCVLLQAWRASDACVETRILD